MNLRVENRNMIKFMEKRMFTKKMYEYNNIILQKQKNQKGLINVFALTCTVFVQLMLNNLDLLLYCPTRRIVQQKRSLRTIMY